MHQGVQFRDWSTFCGEIFSTSRSRCQNLRCGRRRKILYLGYPVLSVRWWCEILKLQAQRTTISRSASSHIAWAHEAHPRIVPVVSFFGSRQMRNVLRDAGHPTGHIKCDYSCVRWAWWRSTWGRRQVNRIRGTRRICTCWGQIDYKVKPVVVRRYYLHSDVKLFLVPWGDYGLASPSGTLLASVEPHWCWFLWDYPGVMAEAPRAPHFNSDQGSQFTVGEFTRTIRASQR